MLEFEPDFERRSCFVDKGQAELKNRRCLNPTCTFHGTVGSGNIVRHGFYTTRSGRRRRYRCSECGKTFSSTKGTPYYRNTLALLRDVANRMDFERLPLIVTDGFDFYERWCVASSDRRLSTARYSRREEMIAS